MDFPICLRVYEECIDFILSGGVFTSPQILRFKNRLAAVSGTVFRLEHKLGQKFILVGEHSKRILEMQVVNVKHDQHSKPHIIASLRRVSQGKPSNLKVVNPK